MRTLDQFPAAEVVNPDNWIGVKQFAAMQRMKPQTVYNLRDTGGNLPPIHRRAGSTRIMFFVPQVREWMNDPKSFITTTPPSPPPPADSHATDARSVRL
ncbi:hypothetical protein ACG33_06070 [Steroidobacter denitrificans]|uniref:Uncharacterized protein n=1 Tax=Steroidobacter denitrificans TaxID=465721 RepID=A0A127F8D1_STEDE|nr:hypothetical protein [Steroidobacter denitrificans]AMN46667.1 hypothetical protein ACG33_06070 [Steroidobacter denitrificans]